MDLPNNYFDSDSLKTIVGATGLIYLVIQTLRSFFPGIGERLTRIIIFIIALLLAIIGTDKSGEILTIVLSIFGNTCLLYVTVIGLGQLSYQVASKDESYDKTHYKGLLIKIKGFFKPFY